MPQAVDEKGNIFEVNADGSYTHVGSANAPQPHTIRTGSVDPFKARTDARAEARDDRQAAAAEVAAAIQKKANDLKSKEFEVGLIEKGLMVAPDGSIVANPNPPLAAKPKIDADRLARLNALVSQLNRTQQLYDEGPGKTKGIYGGIVDNLPLDANSQFDTAGQQVAEKGLRAFRVQGQGSQDAREFGAFNLGNRPMASDRDSAIEEKLRGMRSTVEEEFRALGLPDPEFQYSPNPATTFKTPIEAESKLAGVGATETTIPVPRGLQDAALAYAAQRGKGMDAQDFAAFLNGEARRNNYEGRYSVEAAQGVIDRIKNGARFTGITPLKRTMTEDETSGLFGNDAAMSGFGTYAMNAADALLAPTALLGKGSLASFTDDPNRTRGGLAGASDANPISALLGQISGSAAGAGAVGLGMRGLGLANTAGRQIASDGVFGALQGAGQSPDNALAGATLGGTAGLGGSLIGRGAVSGAGSLVKGLGGDAANRLSALGINPTAFQSIGGHAARFEERLNGLFGPGDALSARGLDARGEFNGAAYREAAGPDARNMTDVINANTAQYDNFRQGVNVDLANDPEFLSDFGAAIDNARGLPAPANTTAEDALIYRGQSGAPNGMMDGRGFQEAYRGLGVDGRVYSRKDGAMYAKEFGDTMGEGQDALSGALDRSNPGKLAEFQDANSSYMRSNILAGAKLAARNRDEKLFTPADLTNSSNTTSSKFFGKLATSEGGTPFSRLADDAQNVLGSRIGDSGTSGRAVATSLALGGAGLLGGGSGYAGGDSVVGGAASTSGATLGALAVMTALNTKGGQAALRKILIERGAGAKQAGETIKNASVYGGNVGASGALQIPQR